MNKKVASSALTKGTSEAAKEAYKSHDDYEQGHIDNTEYASRIAEKAAKNITKGAVTATFAHALSEGAKATLPALNQEKLTRVANSQHTIAATTIAANSFVNEAIQNYDDYRNGTMAGEDYVEKTTKALAKGAVVGAAKTAGAWTIKEGAKKALQVEGIQVIGQQVIKAVESQVGVQAATRLAGVELGAIVKSSVERSNFAMAVGFAGVEQCIDTYKWANGDINDNEYGTRSVQNVGATGGTLLGATIGTMVLPGAGTLIGGLIGSLGGAMFGRQVGEDIFDNKPEGLVQK